MHGIGALTVVELKKLYRAPLTLAVLVLMPVALTLIFYFALSGVSNDYYPRPDMNHFEYLLPGVMGYSVIYMGMMVALALVDYRRDGLLDRVRITPVSTSAYFGSQIVANMIIAVGQAMLVLLVAFVLGFEPQGGIAAILLAGVFLALLAVTAVGLGLITASFANDSGVAGGLSVIFILPMMMFGAFLAVFDDTTRNIARFMPNYYVTDSLSTMFHLGDTSDPSIWLNMAILVAIGAVVAALGVQLFRRSAFR